MANADRPLSPHIGIYRPQITSVLSIVHRITGVVLGAGTLLLTWWLVAAATGDAYYALVVDLLSSWLGRLIVLGFTWCLFYHLCNGIRHLFWDAGYGYEISTATKSGWLVVVVATAITLLAWLAAYGTR